MKTIKAVTLKRVKYNTNKLIRTKYLIAVNHMLAKCGNHDLRPHLNAGSVNFSYVFNVSRQLEQKCPLVRDLPKCSRELFYSN